MGAGGAAPENSSERSETLIRFRCPHCALPLDTVGGSLACANAHSFDRAAEGYVNLLPAGRKRSVRPAGDSAEMILARRRFFDAGHYAPVAERVASMVGTVDSVLDAGCGEGFYVAALDATQRFGIDVSKPAVRLAAKRYSEVTFAVASSYGLPFDDDTFDSVVSVFAPRAYGEFARVVHLGGTMVLASPGAEHLAGLKALIYDDPRAHDDRPHRDAEAPDVEAFERVRFELSLNGSDALNLLQMTPYWWHATADQQRRVAQRDRLETVVDIVVTRHRR